MSGEVELEERISGGDDEESRERKIAGSWGGDGERQKGRVAKVVGLTRVKGGVRGGEWRRHSDSVAAAAA